MNTPISNSKRFVVLYWPLLKDFNISVVEGVFITLIWSLSKKTGSCYASKKKLGNILYTTETTIFSLIKRLIDKKLLERVGYSGYSTSCYKPVDEVTCYLNKLREIDID